jgi:serine/threonine-protein kinase
MTYDPPASGSFPQAPAAPSLVGEVIDGRYRIFKKLGEGGMGEVYAAEHVHIDKKFALKLLKAEIVSNAEAVKRFQQEARSSSSIKHRNIIAVEDFGRLTDGRIYMCMELLAGAALNDMIQQPMAADRLLNILIQAGHGLAAAHAKGIVHRDMKPENIYVTADATGDVPKLLDFGIAKVAGNDGQNNLTRTGTIFGTPFYMAPEQALGNPVDARTDIYAMGVIMYECFAGSLPFQGESFMGILTQHITTDPEPVAQRAARAGRQLPLGIAEIITRCLQKDPKARFQTMDELVNALIGVYRTIAGPGMSTYMEAFPVGSTGHMQSPTPPPMTGGQVAQIVPSGATAAIGAAGAQAPTMAAGYPHPTPGQSQPVMMPPHGSGPAASASGVYDPSASAITAPKKSKAGLIVALAVLIAVGGGVAAVVVLGGGKKTDKTGGGSGSQITDNSGDKGSAKVVTPPDHPEGSGSQQVHDSWGDQGSNTQANNGSGSGAPTNQDGSGHQGSGEGSSTVTPPSDAIEVAVFTEPFVNDFEIWEDGKKVQDGDEDLAVTPGTTRKITVKAKGFKESKPIVIDGKKKRVRVKLAAAGGGTKPPDPNATKPPGIDCSTTIKDPKNKKCIAQFCASHTDDMRCDAE